MPLSNHNSDMKTNNIMVTLRTIGIGLLLLCVNVRLLPMIKKATKTKKLRRKQNTINYLRIRRRKLQVVSLSLYIRVMENFTWRFLSNTCIRDVVGWWYLLNTDPTYLPWYKELHSFAFLL